LVNINDLEFKDKGSSVLSECLSLLFDDLLAQTTLATEIQRNLDELENQMNPITDGSFKSMGKCK
jgi:hypothetical protein